MTGGARGGQGGPGTGRERGPVGPVNATPSKPLLGPARLASGHAGRVVLGLDQAARSGWGIAFERGPVLEHGVARTHWERLAVVGRAVELAGGDARRVFVWFEQHDHMPLDRLGRHDHKTRRNGRGGGVERGPKQLHGMGKAYGRWEAALDHCRVPESNRDEVQPHTWRARIHGVRGGTTEQIKRAAIDWASREAGVAITDDNEAEGVCITAWAALDGLVRRDVAYAQRRVEARAKTAAKGQGALAFGELVKAGAGQHPKTAEKLPVATTNTGVLPGAGQHADNDNGGQDGKA